MILDKLPAPLSKDYDSNSLVYIDDDHFFYNESVDEALVEDLKNNEFQIYTGYYLPKVPKWKKWLAKKKSTKPKLYLIGRGKRSGKQKVKVEEFLPYCYMYDENGDYKTYLGEQVEKIIFECNPRAIGDLRQEYEKKCPSKIPFEADIPFVRRFLCDTKGTFTPKEIIKPYVGIIDVETNFPINDKIISFAINDGKDIYFNSYKLSESYEDLIMDLWERAKQFDIITNWNVEFDIDRIDEAYKEVTGEYDTLKRYTGLFNLGRGTVKKLYGKEIRGSWSLANAGLQIAKTGKVDLDERKPKDLPHDKLIEYNCVDVIVPEEINEVLGVLDCHVALSWLVQCKIEDTERTDIIDDISLLTTYHKEGIVLPSKPPYSQKPKGTDPSYAAAKPLAREGVYHGILKFDVEQAYPTAVVAVNSTPETKDPNGKLEAPNGVRFNTNNSVFIKALKNILNQKADTKAKRNEASKKYGKEHPITKQLGYIYFAIKTQAAAFSHGEFGYWRSRMKDYDVAGAITSTAKEFIFYIMEQCDKFGTKWIYQHSVLGDTPILVKENNNIDIKSIKEIYNSDISKTYVWSDKGWTKIKRAIRHKRDSDIYRTITRQGIVDTTDYHSLLDENANEITPKDIKVGDRLLHNKFNQVATNISIDKDIAWLYGFFMAEGSTNFYDYGVGRGKYQWKIDNKDIRKLKKCHNILNEKFGFYSKILDTRKSSNVWRLVPKKNEKTKQPIRDLYRLFRNKFYDMDSMKKVPTEILNSNSKTMESFLDGYNSGDGTHSIKYKNRHLCFTGKSKTEMLGLVYILEQLGYDYNLCDKTNAKTRNYYDIWITSKEKNNNSGNHLLKKDNAVKKIYKIKCDDKYVYDLETENHHFHAGIGNMIVHNTDSVFVNSPEEDKEDIIDILKKLGDNYCRRKGYTVNFNLDFEDYYPVGYIHTAARNVLVPDIKRIDDYPEDPDAWEVTGMNFMRSETPEELANIEIELIKRAMKGYSKDNLLKYLKKRIETLYEVDSTKLGIIKPLNKSINKYGGTRKDGGKCPIPYHIKALLRANEDYDFMVEEGEKFMIIPIITDEVKGVRKIRRQKIEIAYPIKSGLPSQYKIDFENYLSGNLIGKVYKLFDMKKSELMKEVRNCIPNIDIADEILEKAIEEANKDEE